MTDKRPTPETDALIARQDSEYANKATQTMDYKHRKQLIAHARAMEAQRDQHAKERYWARAEAHQNYRDMLECAKDHRELCERMHVILDDWHDRKGDTMHVCDRMKAALDDVANERDPSLMMKFIAVKKWKDGGETTMEYFATQAACLAWIAKQRKPVGDEFVWCVGEY